MAQVTLNFGAPQTVVGTFIEWVPANNSRPEIPATLMAGSDVGYFGYLHLPRSSTQPLEIRLALNQTESFSDSGPDLSDIMETQGTITFTDSAGNTLEVTGIGDSTEPYSWAPSNLSAVTAFANTMAGLSDRSLTVMLNDGAVDPPLIPDPPTISGINDTDVRVSLVAPDDRGSEITSYGVRFRIGTDEWISHTRGRIFVPFDVSSDTARLFLDAVSTTLDISGLTTGSEYEFQARAANVNGNSGWSASSRFTPTAPMEEVVRMTISPVGDDNIWYNRFVGDDEGGFTGDNIVFEGTNNLEIDRVWWRDNTNRDFTLNRSPQGTTYGTNADFNVFFGPGGPGENYNIYVLVDSDLVTIPVTQRRNIGPHYLNLTVTEADAVILNNVSAGEDVLLAIGRNLVFDANPAGEATVIGGTPSITATGTSASVAQTVAGTAAILGGVPALVASGTSSAPSLTPSGMADILGGIPSITVSGTAETPSTGTAEILGGMSSIIATGAATTPAGILTQEFNLGTNPFANNFTWAGAILVNPVFVENGAESWLRVVRQQSIFIEIRFSHTQTGSAVTAGPELTNAVEIADAAFTFSEAGGDSVTLKGPNHPDITVKSEDPEVEPYFWGPDNGQMWNNWVSGLGNGVVTLTLSDGVTTTQMDLAGTADITGGTPVITATGTAIAPVRAGSAEIISDAPIITASGAAITFTSGAANVIGGTPSITATGTAITFTSGIAEVVSGISTITATGSSTAVASLTNGIAEISSGTPTLTAAGTSATPARLGMAEIVSGVPALVVTGTSVAPPRPGTAAIDSGIPSITAVGASTVTVIEVVRMEITTTDDNTWYNRFTGDDEGSFTGDNIAFDGANDLAIDRVWWRNNDVRDFTLNRNPFGTQTFGTNADFNVYFGTGGPGENYSVYIQVGSDVVTIPITQRRNIAGRFLNLTVTEADAAILNNVSSGDTVTLAIGRNIQFTPPITGTATILGGTPAIIAEADAETPPAGIAEITSGTPILEADGTSAATVRPGTAEILAGVPIVQAIGTAIAPIRAGSAAIVSDIPNLVATGSAAGQILIGTADVVSGIPSLTASGTSFNVVAGAAVILSGTPTITAVGTRIRNPRLGTAIILAGVPIITATGTRIRIPRLGVAEILSSTPSLAAGGMSLSIVSGSAEILSGAAVITATGTGISIIKQGTAVILVGIPVVSATAGAFAVPGMIGLPSLTTSSIGIAPSYVQLVVQIRSTGSGEVFTAYLTGIRLVKANELLDWDERAVAGFAKVT